MLTFINILLKQLKSFDIIDATGVLDFADKINYLLTPVVLLTCSLCIGLRELFSKPLACMTPHKTFHMDYQDESMLEGFCWVQGLRHFRVERPIPISDEEWRELRQIDYYMWVPLLLAALAIVAHLPKLLWDLASFGGLGVDPAELLRLARGSAHRDRARRRDEVSIVADVMRRTLDGGGCSRCCGFLTSVCRSRQCANQRAECRLSICLVPAYLLVKLVGIANIVLQLLILRKFFGLELTVWSRWDETAFPSVGICKLNYQALTGVHSIVAFCTISTNVLTEKVALLLSIYLPIVLSICVLSLVLWIYRLTVRRYSFLAKFASVDKCDLGDKKDKTQKHQTLRGLDSELLGTSGIFLLHMMLINAGELFTSELIGDLYRGYVLDRRSQDLEAAASSAASVSGAAANDESECPATA